MSFFVGIFAEIGRFVQTHMALMSEKFPREFGKFFEEKHQNNIVKITTLTCLPARLKLYFVWPLLENKNVKTL